MCFLEGTTKKMKKKIQLSKFLRVLYMKSGNMPLIADVANSKSHQQLDEILIIFTCTMQEISKLFVR